MNDVNLKDEMNQIGEALGKLEYASSRVASYAYALETECDRLKKELAERTTERDDALHRISTLQHSLKVMRNERDWFKKESTKRIDSKE